MGAIQQCIKHNLYNQGVHTMLEEITVNIMKIKQVQNRLQKSSMVKTSLNLSGTTVIIMLNPEE